MIGVSELNHRLTNYFRSLTVGSGKDSCVSTLQSDSQDKQTEYLMLNASPLKYCFEEATYFNNADTKIPQSSGPPIKVGDEAVHKKLGDIMERAAITASSLEAEQDNGAKIPYWGIDAQTRFETTSKQSNDPPLTRGNTLRSGEDSLKLIELMAQNCTTLSTLVRKRIERLRELKKQKESYVIKTERVNCLEFCDKHNMVAYIEKSEGSEGFHQIISHIKYALTESPTIYAYTIEQFWETAALSTTEDKVRGITATIDRKGNVFVSEASIRRHLKLEDFKGLKTLPTAKNFEQLALIGYVITSDSLTFQKRHFPLCGNSSFIPFSTV
ncbi:hypothetical protein Tco_0963448 [Tanacetum coccineum]